MLPFIEARYVVNSDYPYCPHFHETFSIGAIEQGQVVFECEGKSDLLKPDELAVINPYAVHACNPDENRSRTYHMTYIDATWCKRIQKEVFGGTDRFIPISATLIRDRELYDEYIELNYLLLDNGAFYLKKEEAVHSLLFDMFKKYCGRKIKNALHTGHLEKAVKRAKEYMKENANCNPNLKTISQEVGISSYHFLRTFKRIARITPHQFLLNEKISLAKKLLGAGKSISEVAVEIGFADQSHMHRIFKSIVAATPYEYQRCLIKG